MRTACGLLSFVGVLSISAASSAAVVQARVEIIAEDTTTGAILGSQIWQSTLTDPRAEQSWGSLTDASSVIGSGNFGGGVAIHGVRLGWDNNPEVSSAFNVSSGLSNTTFTINSAIVNFSATPITNGLGLASASITVTDSATFGNNFVGFSGLQPGGNAFSAFYNGTSSIFANLIGSNSVSGPGATQSFSAQSAGFPGYQLIPGVLTEIRSQFRFTLSASDRAAGTSFYDIVIPAPGSAGLLALGGLVLARRRR